VVKKWTSRERVKTALEHREPDRVPIDINPVLDFYVGLKKYLGLDIPEDLDPNSAMEVIPHPSVLSELGVDLISVKLGAPEGVKRDPRADGLIEDEWGVLRKRVFQPGGGSYLEVVHPPLAGVTTENLKNYPWPIPALPGRGEGAEQTAKRLYEETDLALVGRFGGPIIETCVYLLGWKEWLVKLGRDPEFCHTLLEIVTNIQIALDRIGLEAAAKYLSIFKLSGEDLGMQTGPLYSPKMFKEMLLPYLQRRCQAARTYLDEVNPEAKVMLHSCGSIRPYIPRLIEIGIQVLDPVQPKARDMDSVQLKAEFGAQLAFHGGVDIQEVLPFGTKEEVEAETSLKIRAFGAGGGYILSPSHAVQADVPAENVVTMCRTALEQGIYPLQVQELSKS
jgi:uroporphyrinogen decarboxylase